MPDMQPILAFSDMSSSELTVLIGVIVSGIVTIISAWKNNSKMNVAQAERTQARIKADKSEVKIDKTLRNTNGKMHAMTSKLASLEEEVKSLRSQNTTLRNDATVKDTKAKAKRKTPTR